jgi:flagellar basal body rod protein FlgF
MEYLTVVNRTSKNLFVTWDGRRTALAPGKNQLPAIVAEAAKRQNPIMGSEDPVTLSMRYLVGIEEQEDDCSPIEQTNAVQRIDRSKMTNARPVEVVPGDNGIYSVRDVATTTLPLDVSFDK